MVEGATEKEKEIKKSYDCVRRRKNFIGDW